MTEPTDPLEALAGADSPVAPDADFAAALRRRVVAALRRQVGELTDDPPAPPARPSTIDLPRRRPVSSTPTSTPEPVRAATPSDRQVVTPYLAVHDGAAALRFYSEAMGAEVVMRVVGDDGRLGHSEFHLGGARFYLSDEYPDMGVVGPRTLGGSSVTLHVDVDDVDGVFDAAVRGGATELSAPADQPHGARHGTLVDPFGHRWMLSQQLRDLSTEELGDRMAGAGFEMEVPAGAGAGPAAPVVSGGIWAAVNAADAPAMIRFVTDVLGFTEQLVVPGAEPGVVEHSQMVWPEGGVVQIASAHREGNVFSERPVGAQSLYVITADPDSVYRRCVEHRVEVVGEPTSPDYDPGGTVFTVRDHEGNLWSFGTYAG